MDEMLTDSFETLIAEQCDLARVRRIEAGESPAELWAQLQESGFLDALLSADHGGSGLTLTDVAGLLLACGRHVLPLPVGQTMLARAELAHAGVTAPADAVTFADVVRFDGEAVIAERVPFGMTAQWVWVSAADVDWVLPVSAAERQRSGGHDSLNADLRWSAVPANALRVARRNDRNLRVAGAAFTAALLAGAMERAVEMSIAYANERVQFGKPIGKLQAIQQQLSAACEQMYAARTAALLGLCGDVQVNPQRAAVAKSRTSEAVITVAAVGHAVHGAIGITAEYDLQMFTRRLHEWRRDYGSETYWNGVLGSALLQRDETPLTFVRTSISAA